MDKLVIEGGQAINGEVTASGSKNASLKMIFASILTDEPCTLMRVPRLKDVTTSLELLQKLGATIKRDGHTIHLQTKNLSSTKAPYDLVRTMRASVLLLGPLLARERKAFISLPGGCAIGTRPIDLHLMGLKKMGVQLELKKGYIEGTCPQGLKGAKISLDFPSVGATENIMLAATLAQGTTEIFNAAREPEIIDLACFLKKMGAHIEGAGSDTITIEGVDKLKGASIKIMFDRIEAATLLLTAPLTGGTITVKDIQPHFLEAITHKMQECGVPITIGKSSIKATSAKEYKPVHIKTAPFPGFPTDMQAQFIAFLCHVNGASEVEETIFENRFMHVPELLRMRANIQLQGRNARIYGKPSQLCGATVMATDLRASASLVLAALSAKGQTTIRRIYHLDRGYEALEEKMNLLGAHIKRCSE